jgi:hypothetical protein
MEVRVDMMERRNPAVVAGLLGGIVLAHPSTALALSGYGASSIPVADIAIGAAGGALVAGSVVGIVLLASGHVSDDKAADSVDTPESEPSVSEESELDADATNKNERRARPSSRVITSDAPVAAGRARHSHASHASSAKAETHDVPSTHAARHMSAAEWDRSGVIRVRNVSSASNDEERRQPTSSKQRPVVEARPRTRKIDAVPNPEMSPAVVEGTKAPVEPEVKREHSHRKTGHVARDYGDVAENYVHRETLRNRMVSRAEGVAAVLKSRMGSNMMDGIPVITRPDGSVGDVGTGWWERAVGPSAIESRVAFVEDDVIPSDFTDPGIRPMIAMPSYDDLSAAQSRSTSSDEESELRSARSGAIAGRVAFVDEGVYPEKRTIDEVEADDVWTSALKALDEKIEAQSATNQADSFLDAVGDSDTIDEPDGMAADTQFIPFRTPAGHPEVVDTDSYVNYLIDEEFSHSSSTAVRRSSRDFLRMLEGGTSATSKHLSHGDAPVRHGKHFAKEETFVSAAEA